MTHVPTDLVGDVPVAGRRVSIQHIIKVVARFYKMTPKELLERTRRHAVARPRHVAMYIATRVTPFPLPAIGKWFGGYDHTTVIYARDRIGYLMKISPKTKADVEELITLARAVDDAS